METLLIFNNDVALIGNLHGQVRADQRPAEISSNVWHLQLRHQCCDPQHWYRDAAGSPVIHWTGGFCRESSEEAKLAILESSEPYRTYSDDVSGLAIRAVFHPNLREWVIDDLPAEA